MKHLRGTPSLEEKDNGEYEHYVIELKMLSRFEPGFREKHSVLEKPVEECWELKKAAGKESGELIGSNHRTGNFAGIPRRFECIWRCG